MALHDVDIHSADRSSPRPSSHDDANAVKHQAQGLMGANHQISGATVQAGNLRIVKTDTKTITSDGTSSNFTISNLTPNGGHGLGYVPLASAALNNAAITLGDGTQYTGLSIFLPTYGTASLGSAGSSTDISFTSWLTLMVDDQNVYVQVYNSTGSVLTLNVTYYLYDRSV